MTFFESIALSALVSLSAVAPTFAGELSAPAKTTLSCDVQTSEFEEVITGFDLTTDNLGGYQMDYGKGAVTLAERGGNTYAIPGITIYPEFEFRLAPTKNPRKFKILEIDLKTGEEQASVPALCK